MHWGENYLLSNGFKEARDEIEWLLCDLMHYKRSDLYLNSEQKVNQNKVSCFNEWLNQRIKNKPVQYITGRTEFYGNEISVSPEVLIPRMETEKLVEVAIDSLKTLSRPKVLEVGTGSGCIAIAIGSARKDAKILSIDISTSALEIAKNNVRVNKISNVTFSKLDFMKETPKGEYDLIVSNPPYISKYEMNTIMSDVSHYEPHIALTDNEDGLEFYRRFCGIAKKLSKKDGKMILEVGLGSHPIKAFNIFNSSDFNKIDLIPDYNGALRVLKIEI